MTQQRMMLALRSLRDVDGVLGSFVWRRDGQVVASDLPASCTPSTLAAVAVRVQRLCEALANQGEPVQRASLYYSNHRIHVCGVEWAALAVIATNQANVSALELALELSLRDLSELPQAVRAAAPTGPLQQRAVPPPPAADDNRVSGVRPRVTQAAPRSYRGQRIGE